MDSLTPQDRAILSEHTEQLRRFNDLRGEGEVLVSCTEAARILGVTRKTLSAMIRQGRLHKTAIGLSTGIRLREIRQLQKI